MPGFFGNQAIRLLREFWGGMMEPGRREQGAKLLADELYSMFNSDTPLESTVPITVYSTTDAPPIRIVNDRGGDSFQIDGGDTTINGGNTTIGGHDGGDSSITIGDSSSTIVVSGDDVTYGGDEIQLGDTNTTEIVIGAGEDGDPIPITSPPGIELQPGDVYIRTEDGEQLSLQEWIESIVEETIAATSVFLGKVVSGSGDTYQVALYGNGSAQAPTATVTATVPQIDSSETIPAGTWIAAVHRFEVGDVVTYEFQPPVWL